jgi:NAD(P)H-hydrate repair Nnr-like enzyme with NAD(P)H-hydrate dehydratase domain
MTTIPKFTRQGDEPLYPNVLYNRPVTRAAGGRLLIIGGHTGDFVQPTNLYQLAVAAGAGECQVALPDVLAKFLDGAPGATYVPTGPSGALGIDALGRLLQLSENADAVALGASLSNSSQTTILLERLLDELQRPVIAFGEALSLLQHRVRLLTDRPDCLLILTMPEVFKLAGQLEVAIHIRPGGGLINKLEIVRDLAAACQCQLAVYGSEIIIAAGEELVVTPINHRLSLLPAAFWAVLGVFWMHNASRRREGLITGAWVLSQIGQMFGPESTPTPTATATAIATVLD